MIKPIDIIGIVGCALILFAFYRTSIGRWNGKSLWYELDNLVGSLLLIVYCYSKGAVINVVLNLVWAIVALKGVSSISERRKSRAKRSSKP